MDVVIVKVKDVWIMTVNAKEDVNVIMTADVKEGLIFPSAIRPVVVKTDRISHDFSKELKFNISKTECHVIIAYAWHSFL